MKHKKMESFKKWLIKNGFKVTDAKMQHGAEGVFVEIEIIENGSFVGRIDVIKVIKHVRRYDFKYEYRGNYTSMLIWK